MSDHRHVSSEPSRPDHLVFHTQAGHVGGQGPSLQGDKRGLRISDSRRGELPQQSALGRRGWEAATTCWPPRGRLHGGGVIWRRRVSLCWGTGSMGQRIAARLKHPALFPLWTISSIFRFEEVTWKRKKGREREGGERFRGQRPALFAAAAYTASAGSPVERGLVSVDGLGRRCLSSLSAKWQCHSSGRGAAMKGTLRQAARPCQGHGTL